MRCLLLSFLAFFALGPIPAAAQNSVYGVHGIGFLGRPISTRARALGGGAAGFDAPSALNPATVAGLSRLMVTASSGTTLRDYTVTGNTVDGLEEYRFPYAMLGARVRGTPFSIALSYSSYAEQTYDQGTMDSIAIRGEIMEVRDSLSAAGGVSDIRGAIAWRVVPRVNVGAAFHILSGSVRLGTLRRFSDRRYQRLYEIDRMSLAGYGISAGVLIAATRALTISGSIRSDTELKTTVDSVSAGTVELPMSYSAGLFLTPHPSIRWSTTAEWHKWSVADADVSAGGSANAFDTWSVGSGVELGGASGAPLRLGASYATLPFGPTDDQPTEMLFSAGSALGFAGGRASFEFAVERVMRDGAGAEERAWQLMFALSVMP